MADAGETAGFALLGGAVLDGAPLVYPATVSVEQSREKSSVEQSRERSRTTSKAVGEQLSPPPAMRRCWWQR